MRQSMTPWVVAGESCVAGLRAACNSSASSLPQCWHDVGGGGTGDGCTRRAAWRRHRRTNRAAARARMRRKRRSAIEGSGFGWAAWAVSGAGMSPSLMPHGCGAQQRGVFPESREARFAETLELNEAASTAESAYGDCSGWGGAVGTGRAARVERGRSWSCRCGVWGQRSRGAGTVLESARRAVRTVRVCEVPVASHAGAWGSGGERRRSNGVMAEVSLGRLQRAAERRAGGARGRRVGPACTRGSG